MLRAKKHFRLAAASLAVLAASALSCDSADDRYSRQYACSFVFQAQYHATSQLTLCLTNPGSFVIVSATTRQGVTHLQVSTNAGKQEDIAMTTAVENERTYYERMGANRSLIVGCTSVPDFDGSYLKAFDRQCPNCLEQFGGTSYPLDWTGDAMAVGCAKCGRVYNLNANGSPTNGERKDHALLQYKAAYDGSRLYVHN